MGCVEEETRLGEHRDGVSQSNPRIFRAPPRQFYNHATGRDRHVHPNIRRHADLLGVGLRGLVYRMLATIA